MNRPSKLDNKKLLHEYAGSSLSISQMLVKFGLKPRGSNFKTLKKYLAKYNINTSHFTGKGWNTGAGYKNYSKKDLSYYLVKDKQCNSTHLKKRLISEGVKENRCEHCKRLTWLGIEIPLELNHIDGNHSNNLIENLEIICPNCHAIKPNYRGNNIKKSK